MNNASAQIVTTGEHSVDVTVLTSCFNEAESIEEFCERTHNALSTLDLSYDLVFVDDGSTDGTHEKLDSIFEEDGHVRAVVSLARNMGQARAMTAGYQFVDGRVLVVIDSDLQFNPKEIPLLLDELAKGYDLVCGWRKRRFDSLFRRLCSKMLGAVLRLLTSIKLHDFGCTFLAVNMQIIHSFRFGPFREVRPMTILANIPNSSEVIVSHFPRKHGKSRWSFGKLCRRAVDAVCEILVQNQVKILGAALFFYVIIVAVLLCVSQRFADGVFFVIVLFFCSNVFLGLCILLCVVIVVSSVTGTLRQEPAYIVRHVRTRNCEGSRDGEN